MDELTDEQIINWVNGELDRIIQARYSYHHLNLAVSFCLIWSEAPRLVVSVAGNPYGRAFDLSDPDLINQIFEWITGEPWPPLGMK